MGAEEILRFETNVPVTVALKYDDPKLVTGKYGDQYLYKLVDGRIAFVEPIVENRRLEIGIGRGQVFTICKRELKDGQRKRIEWQVARFEPETALEQKVAASIESANGGGERAQSPARATSPAPTSPTNEPPAPRQVNRPFAVPPQPLGSANALALMLRAAVDAAQQAEEYAKEQNFSLRFTSEDVRAMGLSLFIEWGKGGNRAAHVA